jgi:hypothetical protein
MPIGTSVFSDNFDSYANGSDLDTQGNWKKITDVAYGSTAQIQKPASDGVVIGYYSTCASGEIPDGGASNVDHTVVMARNTGTYASDQYSEVTFTGLGINNGGYGVGAVICCDGSTDASANLYVAIMTDGVTRRTIIGKYVAGTWSELTDVASVTWADGDAIGLGKSGTTLTVYKNGSATAVTATDSSHSSGRPGFFIAGFQSASPLLKITNYDGGDIAGGGTTRGTPFGQRGTAFNGGRTFYGPMR